LQRLTGVSEVTAASIISAMSALVFRAVSSLDISHSSDAHVILLDLITATVLVNTRPAKNVQISLAPVASSLTGFFLGTTNPCYFLEPHMYERAWEDVLLAFCRPVP
jgi:hypothetical protein